MERGGVQKKVIGWVQRSPHTIPLWETLGLIYEPNILALYLPMFPLYRNHRSNSQGQNAKKHL